LLALTAAERLVVLGDLVHSRASHQPELAEAFSTWRASHTQLDILLIRGNHDRQAGPAPLDWRITQAIEPFDDGPLMLAHMPQVIEKTFALRACASHGGCAKISTDLLRRFHASSPIRPD